MVAPNTKIKTRKEKALAGRDRELGAVKEKICHSVPFQRLQELKIGAQYTEKEKALKVSHYRRLDQETSEK